MKMNSPTHAEVTRRAQEIWKARGSPGGRDTEFWLEAERELSTGAAAALLDAAARGKPKTARGPEGAAALAERVKAETAAESVVEYLISPPIPEEEAVKAALQTKESRGVLPAGKIPPQTMAATQGRGNGNSQSSGLAADPKAADLLPAPTSVTPVPAPSPAGVAAKAMQQKKAARAPQLPDGKSAHPPTPPQSGKPIWDKPHSK